MIPALGEDCLAVVLNLTPEQAEQACDHGFAFNVVEKEPWWMITGLDCTRFVWFVAGVAVHDFASWMGWL